jgi:hypothetical protein
MDEKYSVEFCCNIRAFYHAWNCVLIFITVNKVYLKYGITEPIFYGEYLQPVSLIAFTVCNCLYLASLRQAALVSAVAYTWVATLAMIYPAAVIDRILFQMDE